VAGHVADHEVAATITGDAAARDVVAFLLADWRRAFHLTTIAQAIAALGFGADQGLRGRVADALLANPAIAPVPRRWGVPTLALTNREKLLGRALARAACPRTPAELAADLGTGYTAVMVGLVMLARCGLVTETAGRYCLAGGWRQRLGPLGWNFHEVRPGGEAAFNVPCAIDFLLLVRQLYPDRRVTIADACAQSAAPIDVVIERGVIGAVAPPGALVFRGGG
jgi:hypothetical protein